MIHLIGKGSVVLAGVLPLYLVLRSRIRVEERMLLHHFGHAYRTYQEHVPHALATLAAHGPPAPGHAR